MPYPDGMTTAALDAHNGVDDDAIAEGNAALTEARAAVNAAYSALNRLADVSHPSVRDAIDRAMNGLEVVDLALCVEVGS